MDRPLAVFPRRRRDESSQAVGLQLLASRAQCGAERRTGVCWLVVGSRGTRGDNPGGGEDQMIPSNNGKKEGKGIRQATQTKRAIDSGWRWADVTGRSVQVG